MKFTTKLASGFVTATMVASVVLPGAFAADYEISGNGSESTNKIIVDQTNSVSVYQNSNVDADVTVNSIASTGGNKASGNTGGDVKVESGNATSTVTVSVVGGTNEAKAQNPCGCESDDSVLVSGNGTNSYNKVKKTTLSVVETKQKAKVNAKVAVTSKAKTGKNKAKNNTNGSVDVTSGDSDSTVDVTVAGGSNTLN